MVNAIEKNEADIDLIAYKAREQEEVLKLVCEVLAKKRDDTQPDEPYLERLDKNNMMPKWSYGTDKLNLKEHLSSRLRADFIAAKEIELSQ